jgi:hypothetical protein
MMDQKMNEDDESAMDEISLPLLKDFPERVDTYIDDRNAIPL